MRLYFTWRRDGRGDQAAVVRDPQRLHDLPRRVIGQPDVSDLALPDEVVVNGKGFLQRGVRVGIVGVVEVDPIRFQPPQARLDLTNDVPARQPPVVDAEPDDPVALGGDHHLVPAAPQSTAKDLLGRIALGRRKSPGPVEDRHVAVHVSRVDEIDAELQRRTDDLVGVLGTRRDTEGGGTQADRRHPDTASAEQ